MSVQKRRMIEKLYGSVEVTEVPDIYKAIKTHGILLVHCQKHKISLYKIGSKSFALFHPISGENTEFLDIITPSNAPYFVRVIKRYGGNDIDNCCLTKFVDKLAQYMDIKMLADIALSGNGMS